MISQQLIFSTHYVNSGIYRISAADGYFYIGSSSNIDKRWKEHKNKLLANRHENQHMQRRFNKYSQEWSFEIIFICSGEKTLLEKEQEFLNNYFSSEKCMNINPTASKPPSAKGRKQTLMHKTKAKLSKILNGVYRKTNLDEDILEQIKNDPQSDAKIKDLCEKLLLKKPLDIEFKGTSARGVPNPEVSKRMMGNSLSKGRVGTFLGKKHSEETKEKIRQSRLAKRKN